VSLFLVFEAIVVCGELMQTWSEQNNLTCKYADFAISSCNVEVAIRKWLTSAISNLETNLSLGSCALDNLQHLSNLLVGDDRAVRRKMPGHWLLVVGT
jgi:hypothetical protein